MTSDGSPTRAVLAVLYEEGIVPYSARVTDYIPGERAGTPEELAALKAADREAEAQNEAFARRIVDAVLSAAPPDVYVEAEAVYGNRAILLINGDRVVLTPGDTYPERTGDGDEH